ncbi:MAG: hypothetical protein D3915_10505 [Candidatus Electrothrix sp. AU1_5]|nr:hypothetical protein [Candidatus Electrothrix gigas]
MNREGVPIAQGEFPIELGVFPRQADNSGHIRVIRATVTTGWVSWVIMEKDMKHAKNFKQW